MEISDGNFDTTKIFEGDHMAWVDIHFKGSESLAVQHHDLNACRELVGQGK
jgi:hypothetical protein